jgi:hypothetical protein
VRASLADGISGIGDGVWSNLLILLRTGSAQALTGEIDPVRIMDEAIKDRVGVRGIAYDFVPTLHGELRGDDGRTAAVSLLKDFEDVVTGGGVEWLQSPIVENEQIGAPGRAQDARMASDAEIELGALYAQIELVFLATGPPPKNSGPP